MLTVEELNKLQVGDWIWVIAIGEKGTYRKVEISDDDGQFQVSCRGEYSEYPLAYYGKTWAVYKNKEEAEQEPVTKKFVDDFCDYLLESKNDCLDDECGIVEKAVYEDVIITFGRMAEERLGIKVFDDEEK